MSNHSKSVFGEFLYNFLTPCLTLNDDSVLFHGVYDRGYTPRASLVISHDGVTIVTTHRGLDNETATIDFGISSCWSSNLNQPLVV